MKGHHHVHSVTFSSLWHLGLYSSRLLCPRDFSGKKYWNGLSFPSTNMFVSIYSWVADKSDLKANWHSWQNHFSYWVIRKHIQWLYYCELYTELHFQYFPCLFMNIYVFLCILKVYFSQFFKSWKLLCIVNISILMSWYF